MNDLIPLGTGNSRFMKSGISPNTTYQQLLTMLINGTFPFDFNGINPAGVSQMGSAYSVANVLPENVCTALDIPNTSEPKDAFAALTILAQSRGFVAHGSYIGSGNAGPSYPNTLTFEFEPKIVIIQSITNSSFNSRRSNFMDYAIMINGVQRFYSCRAVSNSNLQPVQVTWSGNTVTWYHNYSEPYAYAQLNASGATYFYVAMG